MKNSFLHYFFRLLFGLSLIGLGLKTITDINKIEPFVSQTIDQIQHRVLKKQFKISHLKQHSQNLVYFDGFLLIASGLFIINGFRFSKVMIFLAVLLDLLLIHNLYFYKEQKYEIYRSLLVSLFGGVINLV